MDTTKANRINEHPDTESLFAYQPGSNHWQWILIPAELLIAAVISRRDLANSYALCTGRHFTGRWETAGLKIMLSMWDQMEKGIPEICQHTGEYLWYISEVQEITCNGMHHWDEQDRTYKYGYEPQTLVFSPIQHETTIPKDQAEGLDFIISIKPISVWPIHPMWRLMYSAIIMIIQKYSEPATGKTIGKEFAVNLGLTFDLTRVSPKGKWRSV